MASHTTTLVSLDGTRFEFEHDSTILREHSVNSGAWLDGPSGFFEMFSCQTPLAIGTLAGIRGGTVAQRFTTKYGVLELGWYDTYHHEDFRVTSHVNFARQEIGGMSVWGVSTSGPAATAGLFEDLDYNVTPWGIALDSPPPGLWYVGSPGADVISGTDDVILHIQTVDPALESDVGRGELSVIEKAGTHFIREDPGVRSSIHPLDETKTGAARSFAEGIATVRSSPGVLTRPYSG